MTIDSIALEPDRKLTQEWGNGVTQDFGIGTDLPVFSGTCRSFTPTDGIPESDVFAFAQDSNGRLWIGTGNGLAELHGPMIRTYGTGDGLPNMLVSALHYCPGQDILWIGTKDGVAALDLVRKEITHFLETSGKHVVCFADLPTGDGVLAATDAGLVKVEPGGCTTYTETSGLPGNRVFCLSAGEHPIGGGGYWLGTHQGVCHFDGETFRPPSSTAR